MPVPDRPTIILIVDPRHAQTAVRLACKALRGEVADGVSVALRRPAGGRLVVTIAPGRVEVRQTDG